MLYSFVNFFLANVMLTLLAQVSCKTETRDSKNLESSYISISKNIYVNSKEPPAEDNSTESSELETLDTLSSKSQLQFNSLSNTNLTRRQANFTYSPEPTNSLYFDYQPNHLNKEFVLLFDELWKIKNDSVRTLVRLNYFDSLEFNKTLQFECNKYNCSSARPDSQIFNLRGYRPASTNSMYTNSWGDSSKQKPRPYSGQNPISTNQIYFNNLVLVTTSQVHSVWSYLKLRFNECLQRGEQLVRSLHNTKFLNVWSKTKNNQQSDMSSDSIREHLVVKRQIMINQEDDDDIRMRSSLSQNCVELDQSKTTQCQQKEVIVNTNLNNSFPGTLASIEENCKHISYLLEFCWPQQLQQLKSSLASRNDSLTLMTDFPLPSSSAIRSSSSSQRIQELQPTSCGLKPFSSQPILDRVNWMWLNLCMDKKFRKDYADNLRCLAMWTKERAQVICNYEYKRMQTHLDSSDIEKPESPSNPQTVLSYVGASGNAENQMNSYSISRRPRSNSLEGDSNQAMDKMSSSTNQISTTTMNSSSQLIVSSALQSPQVSGELEREMSSKTLCCVFDLFLRCVNKQAVRDCGKSGAQFVVNFMTRIGSDDMRYICNSGSKSNRRHKNYASSRKNSSMTLDRSPFIEGNYCSDPRVQSILHRSAEDKNRNNSLSKVQNSRPNGGFRNKNLSNLNYDSGIYGPDFAVPDCSEVAKQSLLLLTISLLCFLLSA